MGLFDRLYIDKELLPLESDIKKYIPDSFEWQTKSLDNIMTEYFINSDKTIDVNIYEYIEVPKDKRPYPNPQTPLESILGSIKKVYRGKERLNITKDIKFHSSIPILDKWVCLKVTFEDGKLVDIVEIED